MSLTIHSGKCWIPGNSRGKSHPPWQRIQSFFTVWPQLTFPDFSLPANLALSHSPLLASSLASLNIPATLATPCLLQCCFLCLNDFQHSFTEDQLSFCYTLNWGVGGDAGRCGRWKRGSFLQGSYSLLLLLLLFFFLASKPQFRCCLLSKAFFNCLLPPEYQFPVDLLLIYHTILQ